MRIIIITSYPFPFGMAQTNRLIATAKGLLHAGANVKIIITKATETHDKIINHNGSGVYEGIDFEYITPSTIRPSGKLKRIYWFLKGLYGTFRCIARENRKEKVDAFFLGFTFNLVSLLFFIHAKFHRIKLLQERSEYPFLSYSNSLIGRIRLNIYLRLTCKLFDGFIVISKSLQSYFDQYLRKETPVFLLPILVEAERFEFPEIIIQPRISYCGSMQGDKDGVPILIEAFAKIATKFPEVKLYLIGSTEFKGFSSLTERISKHKLESRVVFTGRVEREQMPEILSASLILALARPNTKQAEGGFPTKLGEYLATGRTTIVTAVGDIPDYLTHRVNALLPVPGDIDDFAANIEFALENLSVAKNIGEQGRKLALEIFNSNSQGARLLLWLEKICKYD